MGNEVLTYSIVSIAKINACKHPLNKSKYIESAAGIPILNSGNSAMNPGNF